MVFIGRWRLWSRGWVAIVTNLATLLRVWSTVLIRSLGLDVLIELGNVVHVHLIEHRRILSILRLVVSVNLQCSHLLLKILLLLQLFVLLFLLFLLSFFLSLYCSELVEDILVVQNGVWKLVLEILLIQKHANSLLDNVKLQQLVNAWPLIGVFVQHYSQKIRNVLSKMRWHIIVLALNDLLSQLMQTLSVKWGLKCAHFVKKHAKRPNVTFKRIGLRLDNLRRQIVGCSYDCLRLWLGFTEDSGNSEVSKLYHTFLCQKNVLRLKISMQYLSIVHML